MKLSGKISVHNFIVLILILSTFLIDNGADGCFLNSCPYRRYGRNLKCGSCTGTSDGICVSETICCGDKSCVYDSDCMTKQTCPLRFCEINDHLGFCISPLMCCNDGK
uniref:GRANULINS domain-containing protein n=1 Tax=Rhabditophanes sp. KR3021 TaxID=114890 RepID=A0AC35U7K2_9BILA